MESEWTGMAEIEVGTAELDRLYDQGVLDLQQARDLPCHTGVVLLSGTASALARVTPAKELRLIKADRDAFGIHGRSAEQRVALDLLLDPAIGIVSLGGRAGTGKSALALCAGLEAVLERRQHAKVVVFRPLYAVGGQELGYLPGTEGEKMAPWAQAVFDTLGAVTSKVVIEEVVERGLLEVLPLTHIRGRSLHDSFVIVDEAQSLERNVLLTVLSRIGQDSRVVLTHDVAQRDNLRVGPARRGGRGGGEAEGPSAVRSRDPAPVRAVADRGVGHRDAGGRGAALIGFSSPGRAVQHRGLVPRHPVGADQCRRRPAGGGGAGAGWREPGQAGTQQVQRRHGSRRGGQPGVRDATTEVVLTSAAAGRQLPIGSRLRRRLCSATGRRSAS